MVRGGGDYLGSDWKRGGTLMLGKGKGPYEIGKN